MKFGMATAVSLLLSVGLLACSASTPGGVTLPSSGLPSSIFATLQRCDLLTSASGSALNGKAAISYMALAADGSYNYSVTYTDGTSCTGRAGSVPGAGQTANGGNDVFDFSQNGTYSAVMNSDGSFTLTMNVASQTFTTRTGNSPGAAMRTDVNTICSLSLPTNSVPATLGTSVNCNLTGSGAYIVPSPPFLGATITQLLVLGGRGYNLGTFSSVFTPGPLGTSAPSTATSGFYSY